MRVEEMNVKISIKSYSVTQDSNGRNIHSVTDTFSRWAKVEQVSGSRTLENMGIVFNKAFRITKRYEVSNPVNERHKIEYLGELMTIASVQREQIGKTFFEKITAYTSE